MGDDSVSHHFVPSYTPTLGILVKLQRDFHPIRRADAKMLLAGVTRPFKGGQHHFAMAEVETIRRVVGPEILLPTQSGIPLRGYSVTSASAQDILDNLPKASILHLACHGHQDRKNPLESGFLMHDQMLTVSQLMKHDFPNAFLAFLSACETAKGDAKQPDQVIHLAATMLFVGFKSVIGTMW